MEFLKLQHLIYFFLLLYLSTLAKADDQYFIDCGSSSNTILDGRTFIGGHTNGVKLLAKKSNSVTDTGNQSKLYQTAVIFNSPGSYQFTISENGIYVLRLHFYAFSSAADLTTAQFNVSASGHMLISDFISKASLDSLVVKEFLLTVKKGTFNVFFVPDSPSVAAFVNAIEFFNSNTKVRAPVVISSGLDNNLVSSVLMPVHRINIGGQKVLPPNDKLWRTWLPDDAYLTSKTAAADAPVHSSMPDYKDGNATDYDAPEIVYSTAKELNESSVNFNETNFNATWSFNVSINSIYFVRVHFCDIISEGTGAVVFDLFIYGEVARKIDSLAMGAPFYLDFLVKSDDSGFMNVSIGPRNVTYITRNAYLNGLEIMEVNSGIAVDPKISADSDDNKWKVGHITGLVVGFLCLIGVIAACCCCILKSRKAKRVKNKPAEVFYWPLVPINRGGNSESRLTERTISNGSPLPSLHLKLRIPFSEIEKITNNFGEDFVVGEGGFGKVYKGVLENGIKVAVKRSDSRHGQGFTEFLAEVTVLSKIRHRHLVQLIGYCDENNEMILVYEFMERGTLRDYLYNPNGNIEGLPWEVRLEICIGAARGLDYLHKGSVDGIIHRDVKSSNILLDENYLAKVSDFGLSRLTPPGEQDYISTDVKGTFGYLDPEYCQCLQLTEKSDVYSFGVVLLETLCARQPINGALPKEQVNLADWVMSCKASGELETIVDPTLIGKINPSSFKKFVETAENCLKESGVDRPPMSGVLWDLEYALQLQHGAQQQAFSSTVSATDVSINSPMLDIPSFTTSSIPFSIAENGASMSEMSEGMYGATGQYSSRQSQV